MTPVTRLRVLGESLIIVVFFAFVFGLAPGIDQPLGMIVGGLGGIAAVVVSRRVKAT